MAAFTSRSTAAADGVAERKLRPTAQERAKHGYDPSVSKICLGYRTSPSPVVFRTEHSLLRVLMIFLMGILVGAQLALYLFDYYDDGIADVRSALIGLGMLGFFLIISLWRFIRPGGRGIPEATD